MRSLAPLMAADWQQLLQLQWKDKHIFKKKDRGLIPGC